jgi:hypothetical protein
MPECPAGNKPAAIPPWRNRGAANAGVALPAVGLGTFIGTAMFMKVNDRVFRYCALFIILASGCLMVLSGTPRGPRRADEAVSADWPPFDR